MENSCHRGAAKAAYTTFGAGVGVDAALWRDASMWRVCVRGGGIDSNPNLAVFDSGVALSLLFTGS